MKKMITKILQVAYHRNGVGGAGFHAVRFEIEHQSCPECGDSWGWTDGAGVVSCSRRHAGPPLTKAMHMVASVFDEEGHVAVLNVDRLSDPAIGIAFGDSDGNSWRGDRYEQELRAAIRDEDSDESVRVGSFAIPTKRAVTP